MIPFLWFVRVKARTNYKKGRLFVYRFGKIWLFSIPDLQ
jgi:hypothetical protein